MKKLILMSLFGLIGLFLITAGGTQAAPQTPITSVDYQPVLGDANCDGKVSAVDASIAIRFSVGRLDYNDCISLADVDCDVDIDIADALSILRFATGKANNALCAPGKNVPTDDPVTFVSSQPIVDPSGKTIGALVRTRGTDSNQGSTKLGLTQTATTSRYKSCWSEVYAKNIFGMKVAKLKHNQSYLYDGRRLTTMFPIWQSASSMTGWNVDNLSSSGPYNYGTFGLSWSSARFRFSVPVIGTLQTYWVNTGILAYGWGGCYGWN